MLASVIQGIALTMTVLDLDLFTRRGTIFPVNRATMLSKVRGSCKLLPELSFPTDTASIGLYDAS